MKIHVSANVIQKVQLHQALALRTISTGSGANGRPAHSLVACTNLTFPHDRRGGELVILQCLLPSKEIFLAWNKVLLLKNECVGSIFVLSRLRGPTGDLGRVAPVHVQRMERAHNNAIEFVLKQETWRQPVKPTLLQGKRDKPQNAKRLRGCLVLVLDSSSGLHGASVT